jgi:two-component system nitrate/nitrite response regulator NarL
MRHDTQVTALPGRNMELLQRQIRTIIVDDSAIALQTVCSVAGRAQNLVIIGTATNGNAALEMVRTLHPDLVLLDVEMPVMSGIEATSCIAREAPETRVVIVTVHDSPELRRVCRERGAHGFVAKTALKDELPAVVRQLFGDGHL